MQTQLPNRQTLDINTKFRRKTQSTNDSQHPFLAYRDCQGKYKLEKYKIQSGNAQVTSKQNNTAYLGALNIER